MPQFFLPSDQPIITCRAAGCNDCPVAGSLQCHFGGKQLARFLMVALPPFVLGGVGIGLLNWALLIPWVAFILAYFGLIEIRVMCSHCPHYAETGTTSLKCWANYGSPKLWRYRPGPMSRGETIVFLAGLVLIFAYPAVVLALTSRWVLFAVYLASTVALGMVLHAGMCVRCINFACPLNRVDQDVRQAFFQRNPDVARAWEKNHE